jgi:protein CpxP
MNFRNKVNTMTSARAMPARQRRLGARQFAALTLLLALSGAVLTAVQAQPLGGMGPHGRAHHGAGMGSAVGPMMMNGKMLEAAGASAEQKAQVHEIFKAAHDDMVKQHQGGQDLQQQMMALMLAPKIDAAAAEALRQQMLARHEAVSKRQLQAMLETSAVLTPEQRQHLAERLQARRDMMERHRRERDAAEPRS